MPSSRRGNPTYVPGNQHGAKRFSERPIDGKHPLSVSLYEGHRERLRQIPGWQGLIREYVEKLIEEHQKREI